MLANVQAVFRPKAADVSEQRRLEGERALLGSNVRGALTTLSQAVMRAPALAPAAAGPEPLLALALWARSDALLQLRHFQHSLDDVQLSLKSGLPEDKRYATGVARISSFVRSPSDVRKVPLFVFAFFLGA